MLNVSDNKCNRRNYLTNQIKQLLFEIHQDTATIGNDYGIPKVAEKARLVEKYFNEFTDLVDR